MRHEFVGKTNVVEVVPDIKKAERLLLEKFKSKQFIVEVSSNKYHSVCRDIDRRGWSVEFTVTQTGETNAPIAAARFYNPLHGEGRFRSCEDFTDASKGVCVSSNVTAIAVSQCGTETISFCDAYFTRLAFIDQRIRCRGVLEKIKDCGPFILRPVEGELRDDEYIVHANKYQNIYIHRCKGDVKTCRCNEDDGCWLRLDGKRVVVEGVLSEPVPGCSMVSNEFVSPDLFESKITIDGGSPSTNNVVPAEKESVPHFEYESPCREFKLTVYLADGSRYMIHYYSAVLWMAYIGPDRLAYVTRPFPLYPQLADKKKIEKVWTMLNGLEKHGFPSPNNSCRTSIKCRPKRYSQIKCVEIRDPKDALVKSVKDLFHFVYDQQNNKE